MSKLSEIEALSFQAKHKNNVPPLKKRDDRDVVKLNAEQK